MSAEAKDFIKKILVANPKVRLDADGMMKHPWMKKDLTGQMKLAHAKVALSKYVSVRKDKSQKFK